MRVPLDPGKRRSPADRDQHVVAFEALVGLPVGTRLLFPLSSRTALTSRSHAGELAVRVLEGLRDE